MNEATSLPDDNNQDKPSNELALSSLTDKNWLFIKHYIESGDIEKAYILAGYEGSAPSTKYDIFKKLKPYIEELLSLGKVSRLSLMADLQKALSIPLADKESVSISEFIRLRKFASSLIPELKQEGKLSVLVVNRYAEGTKGTGDKGNTPTQQIDPSNIIDVEPMQ